MTRMTKALLMVLLMTSAACTRPDRFGGDDGSIAGPGTTAGATNQVVPGSADDPNSPLYFSQRVGDRVFFAVDTATLTPEGRATLDGQAQWLASNSDYLAIIEGHADEQGTREYNLALGARRANTVREYLVSRGVNSARLRTISYGKERPVEVCADEACYSKNRRAVTIISATGTS